MDDAERKMKEIHDKLAKDAQHYVGEPLPGWFDQGWATWLQAIDFPHYLRSQSRDGDPHATYTLEEILAMEGIEDVT